MITTIRQIYQLHGLSHQLKTGAEEADILAAEARLGIRLPNDYRELIKTFNGFSTVEGTTEPSFTPIEAIQWLRDVEPNLIKIWQDEPLADVGRQLEQSLIVAGIEEEQCFLLIPPQLEEEDWKYWKFANWIPGEIAYENLLDYFTQLRQYTEEIAQSKDIV